MFIYRASFTNFTSRLKLRLVNYIFPLVRSTLKTTGFKKKYMTNWVRHPDILYRQTICLDKIYDCNLIVNISFTWQQSNTI